MGPSRALARPWLRRNLTSLLLLTVAAANLVAAVPGRLLRSAQPVQVLRSE